jgi:hypothetical protein
MIVLLGIIVVLLLLSASDGHLWPKTERQERRSRRKRRTPRRTPARRTPRRRGRRAKGRAATGGVRVSSGAQGEASMARWWWE